MCAHLLADSATAASGFLKFWQSTALILGLTVVVPGAAYAAQQASIDQRVAHAQQFTSDRLLARVKNSAVVFQWIGISDRFWFRKAGADGTSEFVVVDASTGRQEPLFDTALLTAALLKAGAGEASSIRGASVSGDGKSIRLNVASRGAQCSWPEGPGRCVVPTTVFACDLPVTACRSVPMPSEPLIFSPDRTQAAFVREHNLWVRDVVSGAERRLTNEGVAHFAYGELHDQSDGVKIIRRRANEPSPLSGLLWSPDGRFILSVRHDLRDVPDRQVVTELLPPEGLARPLTYTQRVAITNDPEYPDASVEVIEVVSGTVRKTNADAKSFADWARGYLVGGRVWWSETSDSVTLIGFRRGGREARLIRVDTRSGQASDLIVEKSKTAITTNRNALTGPNIRLLAASNEAIWFSERDGAGHLYLYNVTTGRVKRQLTKGDWRVIDLVAVDEKSRMVYFSAVGKERGRHPYYRHLYRVSLDRGAPELLTPEDADHNFGEDIIFGGGSRQGGSVSPTGRYFIDSYSTTSMPDRAVIRKTDGTMVADIISADISGLLATGWRAPEPFSVKAADGQTDLYGVMFKPADFDPKKTYPVIEITYPPPASKYTPTSFWENFTRQTTLNAQAFAELGAIVVSVDGRGGGYRSLAFRDTFVGSDDWMGAVDHVAVIRNLASTRPYMDLERVGATGHSWGGYASLRAMLLYPEFFKVVVSGEGPGDLRLGALDVANERLFGIPADDANNADYYRRLSNEAFADRLKGKLLLIYGGTDESVSLQDAAQIFHALNKAGKIYDTLIMPDSPHYGGREPYGVMRTLRFFAEHLGGPT